MPGGASAAKPTSSAVLALAGAYGALFGGGLSIAHLLLNRSAIIRDSVLFGLALSIFFGLALLAVHSATAVLWRLVGRVSRRPAATVPLVWSLSAFNLLYFVPNIAHGRTQDESFLGAGLAGMAASEIVRAVMATMLAIALAMVCQLLINRHPIVSSTRGLVVGGALLLAAHCVLPMAFGALDHPAAPPESPVLPARDSTRANHKVLFVGLDGADFRVIEPMVANGELPSFERLMKLGAWGPLATIRDRTSPAIWASIFTGKTPREHRVHDFYSIQLPGMKGTGLFPLHRTFVVEVASFLERLGWVRHRMVSRTSLAAPPVWEILDNLGISTGVVDGYYFSIPARRPEQDDSYLFSRGLRFIEESTGGVTALSQQMLGLLVQPVTMLRHFTPFEREDDCVWQSKTLLSLLDEGSQPDYVLLYCHQPDREMHRFWKWYQPELFFGVGQDDLALYGDRIRQIHREIDAILGQLLDRLDAETTLIVASDHGQSPVFLHHRHFAHHLHGPPGILLMTGPGIRAGERLETAGIYDLMPTVLHLLGLPIAEDMKGRVILDALDAHFARNATVRATTSYDWLTDDLPDDETGLEIDQQELENLRALGYIN